MPITPFGMSFYSTESFESDGWGWRIHLSTGNSEITYEKVNTFPFPYGDGRDIHEEDFDMVFD